MNLLKLGQDQGAFSGVVGGNSNSALSGIVEEGNGLIEFEFEFNHSV